MFKHLKQVKSLGSIYKRKDNFSFINFPFRDYNANWNTKDYIIIREALNSDVISSLCLAHDYLKALIVNKEMEKLKFITRPMIFEAMKQFIKETEENSLTIKISQDENAYTNIEYLEKYDQIFGAKYSDTNIKEKYNIINMLGKKHFKKILFAPKEGILKMRTFSSIIVVDVLFNTQTKIILEDANGNLVQGSSPSKFEKCLIQFTTKNKYHKRPMSLIPKENEEKEYQEEGWKISNVNGLLEDQDYLNIFNYT